MSRLAHRARADQRGLDQRGVALLEVLLVVAITGMLALPMLAWVVLGLRTGAETEDRSAATAARNLVTSYFVRDGASAATVTIAGADCAGGDAAGGEVLVTFTRPASTSSVAYTAVAVTAGSADADIWRRRCDAAGTLVEEHRVVTAAAVPAGGWAAAARCAPVPASPGDPCRGAVLDVPLAAGGNVRATVRLRIDVPR